MSGSICLVVTADASHSQRKRWTYTPEVRGL